MVKNYFKIALRYFRKNRVFAVLNLGGLTISFTACLLIFFWVSHEFSYDKAGANADRVYRVALTLRANGQPDKDFAVTAGPLAPVLVKDIPEVEKAVRFEAYGTTLGYNGQHFFTNQFLFTDSTFLEVFGYPMVKGDAHTALDGANSIVITESAAKKYFGSADPIGKMVTCNDSILLKVTGVMKDLPATTHFNVEVLCSINVLLKYHIDGVDQWWNDDYYTYVLLKDPRSAAEVNGKIRNIMDKYNAKENKEMGIRGLHYLQPLRDIHLRSDLNDEINPGGSIAALRIFIGIAVFLLAVACINYINLTTATSFKRAKEIGIRKVAGAERQQLVGQFLSESILLTILALVLAIGIAITVLPVFNELAGTQISAGTYLTAPVILLVAGFVAVLGIFAGLYPAMYLSGVQLVKVFKQGRGGRGGLSLRKVLVVFQFTLSAILIVATIVCWQQLHFMQTRNLGFDQQQVVAVPLRTEKQARSAQLLKQEMKKTPQLAETTASSKIPGLQLNNIVTLPEGVPADRQQSMFTLVVDFDFFDTYKLKMASGRAFSKEYPTDSSAFILNEAAVKEIGWTPQNAVGKGFEWGLGKKGKVIGVVKDFHFRSLQQKIAPMVIHILSVRSGWYGFLSVRINTGNDKAALRSMEAAWHTVLPNDPFEYRFVNEAYNKQYEAEQRLGRLSIVFSLLTIFISCLGLFGLVMVAVAQRTKEIGVRKVLGASATGIAALLSTDFLKLVGISIVISMPIAYYFMDRWLADFAYRTTMQWWVFAIAALAVVLIALTTIAVQAARAALVNPVESLRSE
ncbi:MAG TPA: ABC transporter permease [Puia sp.]|uniref:ABC transporter permease n=1 Tax=Puia sp. TaxID=2045100 RepID=UPI002C484C93|nr:ABC transporter permease [Puia sp.]HVU97884.1 ABC transporter permease [Puia sp.]